MMKRPPCPALCSRLNQLKLRRSFISLLLVLVVALLSAGCRGELTEREAALVSLEELGAKIDFNSDGEPEFVNLSKTKIKDGELELLTKFDSIRVLWLYDTPIGDPGLEFLRTLKSLKVLVLGHTGITDAGLLRLEESTHLDELYLYDTYVSDQGMFRLRLFLESTKMVH